MLMAIRERLKFAKKMKWVIMSPFNIAVLKLNLLAYQYNKVKKHFIFFWFRLKKAIQVWFLFQADSRITYAKVKFCVLFWGYEWLTASIFEKNDDFLFYVVCCFIILIPIYYLYVIMKCFLVGFRHAFMSFVALHDTIVVFRELCLIYWICRHDHFLALYGIERFRLSFNLKKKHHAVL